MAKQIRHANEFIAKWIVEKYFPQYGTFNNSDRPDLQNELDGIGIEVTDSCGKEWHKKNQFDLSFLDEDDNIKSENCDLIYSDNFITPRKHPNYTKFIHKQRVFKVLERMDVKLTKNYEKENLLGLYIYSDIRTMTKHWSYYLTKELQKRNHRMNDHFDFLILHLVERNLLIFFDLLTGKRYPVHIDLYQFRDKYKQLVLENELKHQIKQLSSNKQLNSKHLKDSL